MNRKPQTRTHEEIDGEEMFVNFAYWNISIIRYDDTGELAVIVSRQQAHTGKYIVTKMMPNKVSHRAAEMLKADRLLSGLVELTNTLKARQTQPAMLDPWQGAEAEQLRAMKRAKYCTPSQPSMLDPLAALPLFSGTAPRVDDPDRFDPPAVSTDTQPTLF